MNGSMGDAVSHEPAPVPEAGLDVPPGVVWPTLSPLPRGGLPEKKKKNKGDHLSRRVPSRSSASEIKGINGFQHCYQQDVWGNINFSRN